MPEQPIEGMSTDEMMEAAAIYVREGTVLAVSREMGIPAHVIDALSRTLWWEQEVVAIKRAQSAIMDARLTKIMEKSLEEIEDRLENGDEHHFKGNIVKTKVDAIALARVLDVSFTKRQILRNEPTSIPGDTDKMRKLADKLKALGHSTKPTEELPYTVEAEKVQRVYDEGDDGLKHGAPKGFISDVDKRKIRDGEL